MNSEKKNAAVDSSSIASTPKKSFPNRILSVILAVLILWSGALGAYLALGERANESGSENASTAFDYAGASIKDYLAAFSSALLTGKTFAGKEYALDKNVSEADAKAYINSLILANAKTSDGGKLNKTKPMDYADKLFFYVLKVDKVNADGTYTTLDTDYFINAFIQSGQIQIGSNVLGEEFDSAIRGKAPLELGGVILRENGYAQDGEETVFIVSYEATLDGEDTVYKTANGERFDMLTESGAFADAIKEKLSSGSVVLGENFSLDLTHDIDEDDEVELVHYSVNVNAAVKENAHVIEATLPEDFFGKNDDNYELCGQKLAFHIASLYSVAYEVSFTTTENKVVKIEGFDDLTAEYISTVLEASTSTGFATDKTDDAEVRAEYLTHYVKYLSESYDSTEKSNAINIIWKNLLDEIEFDKLPEDAIEQAKESALSTFNSTYNEMLSYYASYSMTSPYATIEDFARDYFGYSEEDYESYTEFIEKEHAPKSVKQQLLIYAIYEGGLIEDTYGKYMKLLNEYVDAIIKSAAEQNTTLSRADAIDYIYSKNGGAQNVKESYMLNIVNDYLYENNTIDWELSDKDAE